MTWRADGPDTSLSHLGKSTQVYQILEIEDWETAIGDSTFQGGKGCISKAMKRNERRKENKDAPLFCWKVEQRLTFVWVSRRLQWAANTI